MATPFWIKAGALVGGVAAAAGWLAWQYAERTRIIEGTWLYMFEGSEFFEQRLPGQECDLYSDRSRAGWLHAHPRLIDPGFDAEHPRPSSGTYRSSYGGEWPVNAFELRFEGRRRLRPWGAGHMGLWRSEYEVDRILSATPIPGLDCYVEEQS